LRRLQSLATSGFGSGREILPRSQASYSRASARGAHVHRAKRRDLRGSILPRGEIELPRLRHDRSATSLPAKIKWARVGSVLSGSKPSKGVKLPRRRPTHSRSRREAGVGPAGRAG